MEYNELIKYVRQFTEDRQWDQFHSPENLAKSISIEAGELLECFQWDDKHYDPEHTQEELADVFIYCIQMADRMKVDLIEIAERKMQQNAEKYPVDKARGSSLKYNKLK
ncbi:MAG: nucleotide pyrophosphohydrolase [Erysipelotrichia bacterium]|nr:nucleotide pyrophosphohydrolase [Erysipelotrichia bacterium]